MFMILFRLILLSIKGVQTFLEYVLIRDFQIVLLKSEKNDKLMRV